MAPLMQRVRSSYAHTHIQAPILTLYMQGGGPHEERDDFVLLPLVVAPGLCVLPLRISHQALNTEVCHAHFACGCTGCGWSFLGK